MSTWTDEKHEAARKAAAEGFILHGGHRIRNITLSDALDEIERLRALEAHVGWLVGDPVPEKMPEDTGTTVSVGPQHTLSFKVLSFDPEVAKRLWEEASAGHQAATRDEIPDDMVERAARQVWAGVALFRDPGTLPDPDSTDAAEAGMGLRYRRAARAALEAALNTKDNEA